jgi:hypothetical protein
MGRVYKSASVTCQGKTRTCRVQIDSGADSCILKFGFVHRMKLDLSQTVPDIQRAVGGQRLLGFRLPVELAIEETGAMVDVFVPLAYVKKSKELENTTVKTMLIGLTPNAPMVSIWS